MTNTLRIALFSLAFGLTVPAHAQQISDAERATLLLCDTQKQVERLGEVFAGKAPEAMIKVNTEENNPTACAAVEVAFVPGKVINTVRSKSHTFHVVPVLVMGVNTPNGMQPLDAKVYFTLRVVKEFAI